MGHQEPSIFLVIPRALAQQTVDEITGRYFHNPKSMQGTLLVFRNVVQALLDGYEASEWPAWLSPQEPVQSPPAPEEKRP